MLGIPPRFSHSNHNSRHQRCHGQDAPCHPAAKAYLQHGKDSAESHDGAMHGMASIVDVRLSDLLKRAGL